MPDERGHAVQRARGGGEVLQRGAVLALPVHDVLVPEAAQQVVVLHRRVHRVLHVLAEPRVDGGGVAAAQHQVHAAAGEVLQHREVLGDLHRVVGGDQRGGGGEDELLGLRRDVGQRGGGGGREERAVVVLADGEDVHADLFGLLGDGDDVVDALLLGRGVAADRVAGDVADAENAELHAVPPGR